MDQKLELLARFGLKQEELDFDIADMSEEELEAKLTAMANGTGENDFALTGEQFREELLGALSVPKVTTEWGEMRQYAYCDYDSDLSQVYAYDVNDWKLYGFQYSVTGDVVTIDFESKKRKKFAIIDFEDGDRDVSYSLAFQSVADDSAAAARADAQETFNAEMQKMESKCAEYAATIEQNNQELEELRDFRAQTLNHEREEQEAAVFAMFEDLAGVEAFEALRGACSELTIEELEEKCYALRGRNTTPKTQTFSKKPAALTRLPVGKGETGGDADEPYGGLFQEFPPNT